MELHDVTCDLVCGTCSRYPCGEVNNLEVELRKNGKRLTEESNALVEILESVELPNTEIVLQEMQAMLNLYPTNEVKTLSDLGEVLGLPHDNDKERLAALGVGLISDVAWLLNDSSNFDIFRSLYMSLGKNFKLSKSYLKDHLHLVVSLPKLLRFENDVNFFTLSELSSLSGDLVFKENVLNIKEGDKFVSYLYVEEYLGSDATLKSFAVGRGVSVEELIVKVFYTGSLTSKDISQLRTWGLNEAQIAGIEVSTSSENIQTRLSKMTSLLYSVDEHSLLQVKKLMREVLSYLNFSYYKLDTNLLTLNDKNSDLEIERALQESYINGLELPVNDDKLRIKLSDIQTVEAGTHKISNDLLEQVSPNRLKVLQVYKLYLDINKLSTSSDTEEVANDILTLQINLAGEGIQNRETKPSITFKSYDSGAALVIRTVSYEKTFLMQAKYRQVLNSSTTTLSDKALATILKDGYNAAFKTLMIYNQKVSKTMKDLESIASLGLALNGEGLYQNSYLKCAAGLNADLDYNGIRTILNAAVNLYNDFLNFIDDFLTQVIEKIVCTLKCVRDAIGYGASGIGLPFCTITVPPLDLSDSVVALMAYTSLLDNLLIKNINSSNQLRFALFEMDEAFGSVGAGCTCAPLVSVFDSIKSAIGLSDLGSLGGTNTNIQIPGL